MTGKYRCVHCAKGRGNGCGCVSPFTGDYSWDSMRDELARQNIQARAAQLLVDWADISILYGDSADGLSVSKLLEHWSRSFENVLSMSSFRDRPTGLRFDDDVTWGMIKLPPRFDTGQLFSSVRFGYSKISTRDKKHDND